MSTPITPPPTAPDVTQDVAAVTGNPDLDTTPRETPLLYKTDFLGPAEQPDEIGRLGSYRVLKLLGEGGMGFVYHAEDIALNRAVALKVMRPEVAEKAAAKDRFLREGRAAAKLKNDHVVTIYFVGEANGVPYMALEFLEGKTLDDWLKAHPAPVSATVLVKVARDVLRGLAAAHEKGLVHRDIKPANLWLEKGTSRVKVLDFGLTRDAGGADQVTQSGLVVGTPAYMAPEQAGGKPVDGRTDLFSLGVVLHRMVSGKSPFQRGEIFATLTALALDEPDSLTAIQPSIPPALSAFVAKLLAKKPDDRPASAKAALAELAIIEKALRETAAAPTPMVPTPVLQEAAVNASQSVAVVVEQPINEPPGLPRWNEKETETQSTGINPVARKGAKKLLAVGFLGLILAVVAGFIIIKVTNKDGTVTELKVPDGSKVEVTDGSGKTVVIDPGPGKKPESPKAVTTPVAPGGRFALRTPSHSGPLAEGGGVTVPSLTLPPRGPYTVEMFFTPLPGELGRIIWVAYQLNLEHGRGAKLSMTAKGTTASGKRNFQTTAEAPIQLTPGKTHHLAVVRTKDESQMQLYVDGKLVTSCEAILEGKDPFVFGKIAGDFAEVRVSKVARYDKDLVPQSRFETDADTLALYHFDEGSGDVLKDSSGNNHHGKIVGAKWVKGAAIAPAGPAPPLAKAPFDAAQAKAQQEAWAKHLGVKVETPTSVGGTMVLIPPSDTVPKPYLLGKYEVTQSEWEKVMGYNPSEFKKGNKAVDGMDTSRFPVEQVNWYDCIEFCNKLSDREGFKPYYELAGVTRAGSSIGQAEVKALGGNGYRLPSEREWTYAGQAGTMTKFHFGNKVEEMPEYAWFDQNSKGQTHPVGGKKPNLLGLHDIHGNVREYNGDLDRKFNEQPTSLTRGGDSSVAPAAIAESQLTSRTGRSKFRGLRIARAATAIESPPTSQFVPLFNGKDLTGWADKNGNAGRWTVIDGAMNNAKGDASLYSTRGDYQDFHLRTECKISDGGNSGIYIRAGQAGGELGYEAQINTTGVEPSRTGGISRWAPLNETPVKPDQWFVYDIIAQGDRIQLYVDGVKTADFTDTRPERPAKGHIVLERYIGTAQFRKIEIRELKPGDIAEVPKPGK